MKEKNAVRKIDPIGNPVCRRTYFKLSGKSIAPLLIGSGEDDDTDMDVLLDPYGAAFLPGSSLAGVLKHCMERLSSREQAEALFGKPQDDRDISRQSKVFVYDAELKQTRLNTRDGVCLDEFKTAVDKGKYEMQIIEPGAMFSIYIELVERVNDVKLASNLNNLEAMQKLLRYVKDIEFIVGAKSNRGFGRLSVEALMRKTFSMDKEGDRSVWLSWNWREEHAFDSAKCLEAVKPGELPLLKHCLSVPLNVKHTLLIRQYADTMSEAADCRQLKSGDIAVIPGSSWMGAIRARIAKIIWRMYPEKDFLDCQKALEPFFGSWNEGEKKTLLASKVEVEESLVHKFHLLPITRNSIDRFTGGTISGALYTAEVAVHGDTELKLHWAFTEEESDAICGLLLWAIKDLQTGLLAVGGETAVGRGIFKGDIARVKLDGQPVADQEAAYMQAAACWCAERMRL